MSFRYETQKKNILGELKCGDPIYRIFSYQRFVEMICRKRLTLATPALWDDPFENFLLKSKVDMGDGTVAGLDMVASRWYGQCWTTEKDSDALWRIYSHTKCGIRVKTTAGKLFNALYKFNDPQAGLKYFIGKVDYKSQDEISQLLQQSTFMGIAAGASNHSFAKLLCVKRTEFKHENEVRILYCETGRGQHDREKFWEFDIDPNALFEEVCLDPRTEQHVVTTTKEALSAMGLTLPVIKSPLYDFSEVIIPMTSQPD